MTEHAFENMNSEDYLAGQHIELEKWQNQMELAGYKLEGLHSKRFYKHDNESDLYLLHVT